MRGFVLIVAAVSLCANRTAAQTAAPAPPMPSVSYPTAAISSAFPAPVTPSSHAGQASSTRNRDGHFYVRASLNGATVPMLVDTGATGILLRWEDAVSAGLSPETMNFATQSSTANGTAYNARAELRTLTIGGIVRSNVPVTISKSGAVRVSLLGQSFFSQLGTFRISGDALLLAE